MMEIEYGCVYKRSNKPVMKGSRIEPIEKAINIAKKLKDEYDQLKKKTRDYSGLKAYVVNELYVDDGVVRTRKKDSSNNQS